MMHLDTTEFDRAMVQYLAYSKKSFAEIANAKTRDWLFKSGKKCRVARVSDIKRIRQESWWFKYISKIVVKKYGKGLTKRQFRAKARKEASKLIRRRMRNTKYLQSGFYKAANMLPQQIDNPSKAAKKKPKDFKRIKASIILATVRKGQASVSVFYPARNSMDKAAKERIMNHALNLGKLEVVKSMNKYIKDKQREAARKYSGRR